MKKLRRFLSVIALVLVASLCISSEAFQIVSYAVGEDIRDSKLYVSEVKMFYGTSMLQARLACELEGFIFCPTNLNEGAPKVTKNDHNPYNNTAPTETFIYLGYKTTDDPDNAITDLTLLDMKYTHFEELDYEKYLNDHLEDFKDQASQMMVLVGEMDRKVQAGSPNALMAYDSLNLLYVDENKPHDAETNQLGYYLVNNADIAFFEKFIQRGNAQVLGKITSLLASATADYSEDGKTWVDRAKVSEISTEYANATSATKNMYDQNYEDPAKQLVKFIRDFSETYTEAKNRFDAYGDTLGYAELEGMTKENSAEKLKAVGTGCRFPEYADALKTYALLDAFPFQKKGEPIVNNADLLKTEETQQTPQQTYTKDMTLAEYIMELAKDETLEDHLSTVYPLIHAMTPAQRAALTLSGFGKLIEGLYQSNDYPAKRSQAIAESMQSLKDYGYSDGRIYVWSGTDTSLYNKKVVQTDARKQAAAAGTQLQNSIAEAARKEQDTLSQTLMIIDICTMGYGGIMMIANAILGQTLWAIGANFIECAGMYMAAEMVASAVGTYVLGGLLCAMWALNIICIAVSIFMLVFTIFQVAGLLSDSYYVDYTNMPDVVLDARQSSNGTYSVRYDAVQSNAAYPYTLGADIYISDLWWSGADRYDIPLKDIAPYHADMSGYHGAKDRWVALYYSKATAAGQPIEVKPGQEPFVTKGDYQAPEGYRPLSLIIGDTATNINDIEIEEKKGTPLYMFFPGKAGGTGAGGEVTPSSTYITEVRLSVAEKQQDALDLLRAGNYEYFDVNLTPYSGYTYLGYKRGSETNALRDIRISNVGADSIAFGEASYAKMGQDGKDTTPDGFALYGTKSECAGSPIVSLTVENKRLELGSGREPVCLFSGGNAVDIGTKWKDNILNSGRDSDYDYFLDQGGFTSYVHYGKYAYEYIGQDDPDNGIYIYFQPKEQFKSTGKDGKPAQRYLGGFSYFLAGDNQTKDSTYGSHYEYMQKYAKSNGFELLQKDGEAFRIMSDSAGEMTLGTAWRDVGGYPADTYNFDQYHTITGNNVIANGDGGLIDVMSGIAARVEKNLSRKNEEMIFHTAMYFGVSYTYNPYRAITGISGLITPYTETTSQIKYTGMKTPAGTFQACSVNIQGCPINSPGITAGYYHPYTMSFPLYTNYEARQKSDLSWMTDKETEVLSHYLMTSGPREGVSPLKADDITFRMEETTGQLEEYVPLCDLRTPGDYEHPLNLALDTTNKGSRYLYLYLKKNAGGRVADREEIRNDSGKVTQKSKNVLLKNNYTAKKYVAAVFCGSGRTPEEAIANLYSNAARLWPKIAEAHNDISCRPMVTEFDEIIPVDLSSEHPWYELHCNDTNVKSLKNGVWVRGNEMAYYRWEGHGREDSKPVDEYERDFKCAYIGVVRTAKASGAAYGILKYYSGKGVAPSDKDTESSDKDTKSSDKNTVPTTLTSGSTKCTLAGGPVNSKEGRYFLYYSTNKGTANYQAPITSINISDEIFVNGYNTSFTVSESERKDNTLPQFGQLRMRTDEYRYIHMGYDRAELPYYEALYLGVGDTKEEAYVDMIGTTNAYAAVDVNCNYNSFSKKWIAIGYRRTSVKKNAITDIFLYSGDNPPDKVRISGGYMTATENDPETNENVTVYKEFTDKKGTGVPYKLLKHNLKSGSEIVSLNEGNGGTGLYLYYTTAEFYMDKSAESLMAPITNLCFAYGDISPRYASAEQLADAFEKSFYRSTNFDASVYQDPLWECVMGVEGSPANWKVTADGAARFSLNKGVIPGIGGNGWTGSDNRVYMYVDRANLSSKTKYQIRNNCRLPETGYYSPTSTFGYLRQTA